MRNNRYLLPEAVNDRIVPSRQLAPCWSTASSTLISASLIRRHLLHRGLIPMVPSYRILLRKSIYGSVCDGLMSTEPRRLIGREISFLDKSHFNLRYHDGCVYLTHYAGQRCLPECVIERHRGRIPGVMVGGAISCYGRFYLLRIECNLNSNYVRYEVL